MKITELQSPWRSKWKTATFRAAMFHVEIGARHGGRRVALHQYPKRDIPYAEDMGRSANGFTVQGYLIGPNYLDDRDTLIGCLEQAGPGLLRLPLPYQMADVNVMVLNYAVTEARERGGMCMVEMTFVEYGDPANRPTQSASGQIESAANTVEQSTAQQPQVDGEISPEQTTTEVNPYVQSYQSTQTGVTGQW